MFNNVLSKWMPYREQNLCEKKLTRVIKRLEIENFNFNWDRSSCFIEFSYHDRSYRLEHSIEQAKKRGIILKNGMDCLNELTQSLEDLCRIMERGTYQFETWITGMRQPSFEQEQPEYQEEFHIRYKSLGKQKHPEYNRTDEFNPFAPDSPLSDLEQEQLAHRIPRK
ncbi:hypothetical protein Q7A53_03730 [Halobacillus rhizosphaerae]|uniref:hypothetical protein n=1 Tax=Halobacillus rhizosphaerae TaxID=3064889 RepID=UPI00398A8652